MVSEEQLGEEGSHGSGISIWPESDTCETRPTFMFYAAIGLCVFSRLEFIDFLELPSLILI